MLPPSVISGSARLAPGEAIEWQSCYGQAPDWEAARALRDRLWAGLQGIDLPSYTFGTVFVEVAQIAAQQHCNLASPFGNLRPMLEIVSQHRFDGHAGEVRVKAAAQIR